MKISSPLRFCPVRFPFFAGMVSAVLGMSGSFLWGQGLHGLDLGGGELEPAFDPGVSAYTTSVPAVNTGIAVHPRVLSVDRAVHVRDAAGRFRVHAPGATVAVGLGHAIALRDDGSVVGWGSNAYGQSVVPAEALSDVVAVAAGHQFSMALKADGSVLLWGENSTGPLAVPAEAQSGVVAIAGGGSHALALKEDGSVIAWGANGNGQTAVPEELGGVTAIAAGAFHSVALKEDGSVQTWGYGLGGVPEAARSGVVAVSAGDHYVMALREDGEVVVWGNTPAGGLFSPDMGIPADVSPVVGISAGSRYPATLRADGTVQLWTNTPELLAIPADARDAVAVVAGRYFAGVVKADGTLRVWGQSGHTTVPTTAAAGLRLPKGARISLPAGETPLAVRVAAPGDLALTRVPLNAVPGGNATYVLDADGNPATYSSTSDFPAAATGLVAIAPGVGLKADGTVIAWDNSVELAEVPAEITQEPAVAITTTGDYQPVRFALGRSGVLRGWPGVPWQGSSNLLNIPTDAQSDVVAVDVVNGCAMALRRDGRVVAWGYSNYALTTVPTEAQAGVVAVAVGEDHAVALRADDTLVFWGKGYSGYGSSSYSMRSPKPVAKIDAGRDFTVVLFADGTLDVLGLASGSSGEAVRINWPSSARDEIGDVAAGRDFVTVLKTDGTLITWGDRSATRSTPPGALLRAGPAGEETVITVTRAAPGAALASLTSSGGAPTPAFDPETFAYSQTLASGVKGVALSARAQEPLAGWELAINGGPVRRMAVGATLAAGSGFNLGINTQGALNGWGWAYSLNLSAPPSDMQSGLVAIAAGSSHALALKDDCRLVAWGPGDSPMNNIPAAARHDVVAIAARGNTSAVLRRGGTPVLWGYDTALHFPPSEAKEGVSALALGFGNAAALKNDGSVVTWGAVTSVRPDSVLSGVVAVAAGQGFTLALKDDGSVVSWGTLSYDLNVVPATVGKRAVAIAAGRQHAMALLNNGAVVVWGYLSASQPLAANAGFVAIAAGDNHCSALRADGSVATWGTFPSQTGDAEIRLLAPPGSLVPLRSGVNRIELRAIAAEGVPLAATPIVAGHDRDWFLRADGASDVRVRVGSPSMPTIPGYEYLRDNVAVGVGGYGEYVVRFDGTVRTVRGPTPPSDLISTAQPAAGARPRAVRVAVSEQFAAALLEDGAVRAWGNYSTVPAELATGALALSAGRRHLIGLTGRGGAVVWGDAWGSTLTVPEWAGSGLLAVAAGEDFNLVLKRDGTLGAWGENFTVRNSIPTGSDFIAIAAGYRHALALRRDGAVVAWGENSSGQTLVPELAQSEVVAIAAAGEHNLALRSDGVVVAWGNNAVSSHPIGFAPGTRRASTFDVERAPASPALVELGTSAGSPTPAFSPDTLGYSLDAPSSVAAMTLAARAEEPGQLQMRINGLPFQRVTSGPSLASGNGFVVGIGSGGGAVFPVNASSPYTNVPLAAQSDLVAIEAGAGHILALRADGATVCWGQSGPGLAIPAAASADIAAVAARAGNSLVLRRDGTIVGWGQNSTLANVPPFVGSDNRAIALGVNHALVLKNDGGVIQWGSTPSVPAEAQAGVVAIAAGDGFSFALKTDGTVVPWGNNSALGSLPASATSEVVAISAGRNGACFIKADGSPVFWSTTGNSISPANFPAAVAAYAGGEGSPAVLFADGRVAVWTSSSTPTIVTGPVALPVSAPRSLREGENVLELRVTPAEGRLLHEASFATGANNHLVVGATGSVLRSRVAEGGFLPSDSLPVPAQSGVHAIYARGARQLALRHDGTVVSLSGDSVPLVLRPGYSSGSSPQPARAIALALGASETLTLRADGSVFAWINDSAVPADARSGVVGIAANGNQLFAVRADGRLVKWNTSGGVDPNLPATTQSGVLSVVATAQHGLVLKKNGTLFAWRLDNASGGDALRQVPVDATDIVAIAAADQQFLALRRDGRVFSWGNESLLSAVPTTAQSGVVALAAGPSHALALRADGAFVCWGRAQAGGALLAPSADGLLLEPIRTYSLAITRAPALPAAGALRAVGGALSPAFSPETTSYALPATPYPALAITARANVPGARIEVRNNGGAYEPRMQGATVAVSDDAVLALRPNGSVQAFGSGTVANVPSTAQAGIVAVAAGRGHALALRRDGQIIAWGSNSYGQTTPPAGASFVAVAAGAYHNLAITAAGGVVAWGRNYEYQCLVPEAALSEVVMVAAGERTSIALKADGTVVAWGGWQLPQTIPADAQSDVAAVAAGHDHYLALRSDGRVVQWGPGPGGTEPLPFPVIGIAAGAGYEGGNLALRADGDLVAWAPAFGPSFHLPVADARNIAAFSAGNGLAAAIAQDGSLRVFSTNGSSLGNANGTAAYAGPYALPLSGRLPLALGTNELDLRFSRSDDATGPVVYRVAVHRQAAPAVRMVAGDDLVAGNPSSHDFGSVAVGGSASQLFTLHNPGSADLVISGYQMSGAAGANFAVSGLTPPATVPPGGSVTFQISAVPSAAGMRLDIFLPVLNLPDGEFFGYGLQATGFTFETDMNAWRSEQFSAEERGDPELEATVWGDLADPDGDGLPNLLEYALGLDARQPGASPVEVSHDAEAPDGPVMALRYTRPKRVAATGVVYRVTWSDSLAANSWTTEEVVEEVVAETATTETVVATRKADGPRRFMRLEVEAPSP